MAFESYWIETLPQPSGEHLIHTETCRNLPVLEARTPLGLHKTYADALGLAQLLLGRSVSCPSCVREEVAEPALSISPPAEVKPSLPQPSNTLTVSARLKQPNRRRQSNKTSRGKDV
jgi:hypothetical protein